MFLFQSIFINNNLKRKNNNISLNCINESLIKLKDEWRNNYTGIWCNLIGKGLISKTDLQGANLLDDYKKLFKRSLSY